MKTINSVKISNFQSHKNTFIDFAGSGCLTVITGPSDSGKSAVIRAIRWLCYNTPQGSDFITVGEDKCSVAITFEDGTTVERIRTRGGVNRYTVNGEVFEGFGTSVPLEVQQATGIKKLQIGDMNFLLNLSEQLDGPFLGKSVPGSARAKVLGKLAGTEEIDFAGKELGTDIYRAKRQQEGLEKDIETIQKAIGEYFWIEDKEARLNRLQVLLSEVKRSQQALAAVRELMQKHNDLSKQVSAFNAVIALLTPVDLGLGAVGNAQKGASQREKIVLLLTNFEEAREQICDAELIINQLKRIEPAVNLVTSAQEKLTLNKSLSTFRSQLLHAGAIKEANLTKVQRLFEQYEVIMPLLDKAIAGSKKAETLDQLYKEHFQSNIAVTHHGRIIRRLSRLGEALDSVTQANSKVIELQGLKRLHDTHTDLQTTQTRWSEKHVTADYDVIELEGHYIKLMSELGKCPTCGSDINVEKLREVI